jgi:hypothetical protein
MENTTPNNINPSGPDIPQITVQDLAGLQSVIEAACQRGAFRANEMKTVGELYDRLAAFLKAIQPVVAPPEDVSVPPITEPTGE